MPDDTDAPATWPSWATIAQHLIAPDPATSDDPRLRTAAADLVLYLLRRGETRVALGERVRARDRLRDSADGCRRVLGDDHPRTLRCELSLARLLLETDSTLPARRLADDVAARMRDVLGPAHPETRHAAKTRAVIVQSMGGRPKRRGR